MNKLTEADENLEIKSTYSAVAEKDLIWQG